MDHRRRGGNGAAAADGGAYTDEGADIPVNMQQLMHRVGHQQRRGDGADDDGQGLLSGLQHHIQIQPEAQQHHGGLQDLLGGKADARLTDGPRRPQQGNDHAQEDGENRPADDRHQLAQQP